MKLFIEQLPIETRLGIFDEEQAEVRIFTVDIELEYNAAQAIAGDDFAYAVDYAVLEGGIRAHASSKNWQLVETLADSIANYVGESHILIQNVIVTVHKPQAMRFAKNVSLRAYYEAKEGNKK